MWSDNMMLRFQDDGIATAQLPVVIGIGDVCTWLKYRDENGDRVACITFTYAGDIVLILQGDGMGSIGCKV